MTSELIKRLRHRAKFDTAESPYILMEQAATTIETLRRERDEAQSACTAWQGAYEGLEAHLQDRVNMGDEAKPDVYLYILRGYVANIIRDSRAICASRWADYGCHEAALRAKDDHIASLEAALAERDKALVVANAQLADMEFLSIEGFMGWKEDRRAARALDGGEG
jgi:hypothetical protein